MVPNHRRVLRQRHRRRGHGQTQESGERTRNFCENTDIENTDIIVVLSCREESCREESCRDREFS